MDTPRAFQTKIPKHLNDVLKRKAGDCFMSRQKYIEKIIADHAESIIEDENERIEKGLGLIK